MKRPLLRNNRTTLFGILNTQGFGPGVGLILFGAIVGSQPPSTYPVFGYGKPPPIVIDGLSSYYWAIPAATRLFSIRKSCGIRERKYGGFALLVFRHKETVDLLQREEWIYLVL